MPQPKLKGLAYLCSGAAALVLAALVISGNLPLPQGWNLSIERLGLSQAASVELAFSDSYATPGTYSFVVPAGTTEITTKLWGGGGHKYVDTYEGNCGGGKNIWVAGNPGGAGSGGYTGATIPVTSGETLTIVVGAFNGGGSGAGYGGGYSGIFRGTPSQANALVVAGAGGGSGAYAFVTADNGECGIPNAGPGPSGGYGGGLTGGNSGATGGGTQSAGGAGYGPGSSLTGGNGNTGGRGGGGGAGYWGGAGGTGGWNTNGTGGGGGSGYCKPGVSNCTIIAATSAGAANSTDPDRPGSAGNSNQNGAVVVHGFVDNGLRDDPPLLSISADPTSVEATAATTSDISWSSDYIIPNLCSVLQTDSVGVSIPLSPIGADDNGSKITGPLTTVGDYVYDIVCYSNTVNQGLHFHNVSSVVAGQFGNAVSFSNNNTNYTDSDQYITIPDSALQDITDGSYTVSAWFKPANNPPGDPNTQANDSSYAIVGRQGWFEGLAYQHGGNFLMSHYINGGTWTGTWSTGGYTANTWHHVVGVVDVTAGTVKIYVDNTLAGTGTLPAGSASFDFYGTPWYVGIAVPQNDGWRWGANGVVDDLRFFNRALSASEISTLYAKGDVASGLVSRVTLGSVTTGTHGQHFGDVSATAGAIGQALSFTNDNTSNNPGSYVNIPNDSALLNLQNGDYSISAWFKPENLPPSDPAIGANDSAYAVVAKTGWHTGIMYNHWGCFGFEHYLQGDVWRGAGWGTCYSPGEWYHVVGIVDKTAGTIKLYVNAQNADWVGNPYNTFTPGTPGRDYGGATWKIGEAGPWYDEWRWGANGAIDDVRFYNRALSLDEVQALYDKGDITDGLVAYFPLDSETVNGSISYNIINGLSNAQAVVTTIEDICTDIPNVQSSVPTGCQTPSPSPGICIPAGYEWNGSACVEVPPPTISQGAFFANPNRVRKGESTTLYYTVGSPPASCSLTATNGFSTNVSPQDGIQTSTQTNAINQATFFTLNCDGVSAKTTVNLVPNVQEI